MKEAWKRQREGSNASTGFIVWEGPLWRRSPARELEPKAADRLGVDIGIGLEGKRHCARKFFWCGVNHH
jgi:hypothetical protein